jgi:hypothetical protein
VSQVITNIVRNANRSWTFTWEGDPDDSHRIILWGILLTTVEGLSYTWEGQEYVDFPPPLEITLLNEKALSETFLPYFIVQWYGSDDAEDYLVQKLVGNTWTTINRVGGNNQWVYTFQTAILIDETTYDYRIVAINSVGDQSVPRRYRRFVVCPPKPPDGEVIIIYNKPNLTLEAAS